MFTSLWFLALFGVVALAWYRTPAERRWLVALAGSLVCYLALDAAGFVLMLLSALLVWLAALRAGQGGNKGWLAVGAAACLLPLAALKYIAPPLGMNGLLVPFGISYYTLQLLGYLLDVWYGKIPPEKNPGRVLCYGAFFLSITQGPFNRYGDLMPQLDAPRGFDRQRAVFGLQRMAWGYFQKFAVADRLALAADAVFGSAGTMDRSQLLFGVVAYSLQLYADFAGYTNLALGAGEVLGLRLPENFRQPYFAQNVSDFWRRWHVSLSFWFRDYVYIPLGGNRRGLPRQLFNLLIVWVLTGIWHGAGSGYLTWGLYYFVLLAGSLLVFGRHKKAAAAKPAPLPLRMLRALRTSALACLGWLFFRAGSLSAAFEILRGIALRPGMGALSRYWEVGLDSRLELLLLFAGVAVLFVVDLLHEKGIPPRKTLAASATPLRWAVYQAALWSFLFMGVFLSSGSGFLYARY